MSPSARLGGFKILKDVVCISVGHAGKKEDFPAKFLRVIAEEKINLPFLACGETGLSVAIQASELRKASEIIKENFGKINHSTVNGSILSIFPHRSNPAITSYLLDVFGGEGMVPDALSNSSSAISAFLREEVVSKVARALFQPFEFSAYRTPAEWSLAQTGKERLYKEVVASYQEKRPKVYALEWLDAQELLCAKLKRDDLRWMGAAFTNFARMGLALTFLIMGHSRKEKEPNLSFCLSRSDKLNYAKIIKALAPTIDIAIVSPVTIFSMTGPHFGDRYGITSELLMALNNFQVDLLALSCSVASIIGVVPADQVQTAIRAIKGCFEIPSVIKKTPPSFMASL